jgi:glutathione S-transferase
MLTLHHAPQSRSSRIVWLLEELGANYELKLTDIPRQDGTGGADADNPHPDKKVPALVHNGVLITESIAIILYLTDLYPKAGVGPLAGDPKRGSYLTWLAYYAGVIEPMVTANVCGVGDAPWVVRSWRSMDDVHARVGAALADQPYLLGDHFSAADLLIASMAEFMRTTLPPGERVDAYLARCFGRPALARSKAKDGG